MPKNLASSTGGSRFHSGIFVGIDARTGQYMLYADDTIKLARTVVRVPTSDKWDKSMLQNVRVTPYSMHTPKPAEVVFQQRDGGDDPDIPPDRESMTKKLYLRPSDFVGPDSFGLTRGCRKCDYFLKRGTWSTAPHSDECRSRVEIELSKTTDGKRRLALVKDRHDRAAHDLGNADGRQDLQGEMNRDAADGDLARHADEHPPANFDFIPIPEDESRRLLNEISPDAPVQVHRGPAHGGHDQVHSGGHVDEGFEPDSLYADRGPMVESDHETPMDLPREREAAMDIDVVEHSDDLRELFAVLQRDEKMAIQEADDEILAVIKSLGGSGSRYRRERQKALRAVVSEIYSPPRVTAATKLLPELRLIPGFALDLTTKDVDGRLWDFDEKEMQDRALAKIRDERPMLLIGSPMCTAFSTWQRINNKIRDASIVAAEKARAVKHLEFCIRLYREQLRNNRYFLHEHPAYATSWQESAMQSLMGESWG